MITKKYRTLIKVDKSDEEYLTITNVSNSNGIFKVEKSGTPRTHNLEYSFDKINWTNYDLSNLPEVNVPNGAKLYLRGNNPDGFNNNGTNQYYVYTPTLDVDFNVSGNAFSLRNPDVNIFSTITNQNFAEFKGLFAGNSKLIDASKLYIGTGINNYSCQYMFNGCSSLKYAPELPATTTAYSCYNGMFQNCTSLEVAPVLPAEDVYATGLSDGAYKYMFSGCTSLKSITCFAKTIGKYGYGLSGWLDNISSTGTFYKSSDSTLFSAGQSGIPSGWTVVDA